MEGSDSSSSHSRSKGSIARSLLQRVHSKKDGKDRDTPPSPSTYYAGALPDSPTSQSSAAFSSGPLQRTPTNSSQKSKLATNNNNTSENLSAQGGHADSTTLSPTQPKQVSIEQSVKLFKTFEALRNGDTAAINKAIRETGANSPALSQSQGFASNASQSGLGGLEGTSILHLAVQCAELNVIEYVLSAASASAESSVDINARDKDGNTPLHIASMLSRASVVKLLLDQKDIDETITNYQGKTALDMAKSPEIFQHLQLARSLYIESNVTKLHSLVTSGAYDELEQMLRDPHIQSALDVNGGELATDHATIETGGTLLHEAARKKDIKLIQLLLHNGADPFRRDRKGRLPQDVTKDDRTRAILKKSPAAAAAQRGIQEKTILGSNPQKAASAITGEGGLASKESREMKGYLKKWTNYTSGYKLRWFVLEDGVLSYYKHQDDAGSACRGAINMRIAQLHMDPQDKLRFEIHGKSSVKYHLKANHEVECKRWYWALTNAIQWSKDEAKEEQKRQARSSDMLRQAKVEQRHSLEGEKAGGDSSKPGSRGLVPGTAVGVPLTAQVSRATADEDSVLSTYEPSLAGDTLGHIVRDAGTATIEGDIDDDEDYGDDASSREVQPASKDAFSIIAQSAKLQMDLMAQVTAALQAEQSSQPSTQISHPNVIQALSSYEAAVGNLKGLIGDLLRISKDRDAYWQYRLEKEANMRRLWEDSMARVAEEQEQLQERFGESEEKRRRTKRALRDALEGSIAGLPQSMSPPAIERVESEAIRFNIPEEEEPKLGDDGKARARPSFSFGTGRARRRSTIAEYTNISDSESEMDEEFFDAIDAGEVEVISEMPSDVVKSPPLKPEKRETPADGVEDERTEKGKELTLSFKGYEAPIRTKLKLDADHRPKVSLWGVLKSMIGKDMTKMTLPVSFNEPTSLLQRVAEDMEYSDLLDIAAERNESTERLLYVAAFAASEYASTIGRVAKPFNPLLGETYEYVRPDKGYRFVVEQVSHHPPVGAAWVESPKWEYYGESAVKSKFYGKSFEFNPLGTWFLRLWPASGGPPELYTWKKVTSSVVGIITGNPSVDNYGMQEIRNHGTGEVCYLDFKPKGWKASSAYQVQGKIVAANGETRWSIGGRWNDKIYARLTPGYEADVSAGPSSGGGGGGKGEKGTQAFLVWQASARPTGIPFNLTPFGITLNALPEGLQAHLPPTDTRLRPDQRAMEDGEYDLAAREKNRLEEKQRASRRSREASGEEFVPKWFHKTKHPVTGEEYWQSNGEYWKRRMDHDWSACDDIF